MSQRITITATITDEAWNEMLAPIEDTDGSTYQATPEEMLNYFVEYASGAYLNGVEYAGMLELIDPSG